MSLKQSESGGNKKQDELSLEEREIQVDLRNCETIYNCFARNVTES